MRACRQCGSTFQTPRWSVWICSDDCRRERKSESLKIYHATNWQYRERKKKYWRDKRAADPAWADKQRAGQRAYKAKMASDPAWADKQRAGQRAHRAKKAAAYKIARELGYINLGDFK